MIFKFEVTVEVERTQGKFASRDTIESVIQDVLSDSNPDEITTDEDAQYNITSWDVDAMPAPKRKRAKKAFKPKFGLIHTAPVTESDPKSGDDV